MNIDGFSAHLKVDSCVHEQQCIVTPSLDNCVVVNTLQRTPLCSHSYYSLSLPLPHHFNRPLSLPPIPTTQRPFLMRGPAKPVPPNQERIQRTSLPSTLSRRPVSMVTISGSTRRYIAHSIVSDHNLFAIRLPNNCYWIHELQV